MNPNSYNGSYLFKIYSNINLLSASRSFCRFANLLEPLKGFGRPLERFVYLQECSYIYYPIEVVTGDKFIQVGSNVSIGRE